MSRNPAALLAIAAWCAGAGVAQAQRPLPDAAQLFVVDDPACQSATLVSTDGQFPRDRHTLAIRWAGYSNFELAYDGHVLLLDAYFDRGSLHPPLGFKAADIRRADAILLGHGHSDHMSDAASVGARIGAQVVGAPVTTEKLLTQAIDSKLVKTVTGRGGERLEFHGMALEPILGRHSVPPRDITAAFNTALRPFVTAATPEQQAEQAAISRRGTSDPRVVDEGTIAYLITLDTGFRIMYRDSAGDVTDYERSAMQRIGGRVDVALVALAAAYLNTLTERTALEHARAYKPRVFMPAHHDAPYTDLWRATEPVFQSIKDDNPAILTMSRGYREPVCFNTEHNVARDK